MLGAVPDPPAVTGESAQRWLAVRRTLTAHRHELGRVAARLYPEAPRPASADLLCREEWLPAAPLELDDLALRWQDDGPRQRGGSGCRDGARGGAERYAEAYARGHAMRVEDVADHLGIDPITDRPAAGPGTATPPA